MCSGLVLVEDNQRLGSVLCIQYIASKWPLLLPAQCPLTHTQPRPTPVHMEWRPVSQLDNEIWSYRDGDTGL